MLLDYIISKNTQSFIDNDKQSITTFKNLYISIDQS